MIARTKLLIYTVLGLLGAGSISVPIVLNSKSILGKSKSEQVVVSSPSLNNKGFNQPMNFSFTEDKLNQIIASSRDLGNTESSRELDTSFPGDEEIKDLLSSIEVTKIYKQSEKITLSAKLSVDQRKALQLFFRLYANLENSGLAPNYVGNSELPQLNKKIDSSKVFSALSLLDWDKASTKITKEYSKNNGEQHPISIFYPEENSEWESKLSQLKTSGIKESIELDISSWLIQEMERIHKTYLK